MHRLQNKPPFALNTEALFLHLETYYFDIYSTLVKIRYKSERMKFESYCIHFL